MTMDGAVVKCRDIKRSPEGDRFDRKTLDRLKGLPWRPKVEEGEDIEPAGKSKKIEVQAKGAEAVGQQAVPSSLPSLHRLRNALYQRS